MPKAPEITQAAALLNSIWGQGKGPDSVLTTLNPLPLVSPGQTALLGGFDPVINTIATSAFGGSSGTEPGPGPGPGPDPGDAAVVGTAVVGTDIAG